ncbi:MAG: 4Fe-4S dicluster domain-containing protein [Candidatus Cryptobacteroides sp.]|nr:4Fe-4S dicluster domain-containing protein [Bacteroidales bacterium]MDY5495005.1 4Fe-4S dicluster domain-containing protein [Candidatus Cryptobacteroides sp.]
MLRKIRITLASIVFILCAALFLDGSGTVSSWFGWLAKLQFLPALLALNLAVVIVLIVLTLIFGRAYCSVICPLGIMQDGISHISSMRKGKKARFRWSPEVKWLRYSVLALFIIVLVAGLTSVSALLAPYSAFGRIATSLVRPALPTAIIAGVTLLVVGVLAWIGGRTYCNTVCPVGTVLSFFSRFSLLRPVIDADKCRNCRACEHKCKASCINIDNHEIDYSRCVDCFNCLDSCRFGALKYRMAWNSKTCEAAGTVQDNAEVSTEEGKHNAGRRAFISSSVIAATAIALEAQEKKVDGGYAAVTAKKAPERTNPIVPFGAVSLRHFHQHCTRCQLCVSQCPNDVLRPSTSLDRLMLPEMSYENGWCRPECTKCSEVCPAGAILEITPEEKTAIHVGTASVDLDLCVVNRDNVNCGNCARHCPAGAIMMVRKNPDDENSLRIPTVLEDRCIGCGACEFLCPSRPYSAIHVNGRIDHVDNR